MATNNATASYNNLLTHNPATTVGIIKVTSLKPFNANTMPKEDQLNGSANILFPHKCEDNSAPHSTTKSITILTTTTPETTTTIIINPTSCSTNELSLCTTKTTLLSAVAVTATTTTTLACSSSNITNTPAITTTATITSTISIATSITTTTTTTATNIISSNADIKHLPTFLESKTNHHHNNIINNDKNTTTKTITATTTTNNGNKTIVKDSLYLSTLYDNRNDGCSNNYKINRESNNQQQHHQQLQHTFINVQPRKRDVTPTQETSNISFLSASSIQDDISDQCKLTKAGLEEYNIRANSFYDNPMVMYQHQKQSSYAQSEGYHSYVSSSDSTSATPFLDRLRQESELLSRHTHNWSQNDLSSLASNSVNTSPTSHISQQEENHASGQPNDNTVNNNNDNDNGNNGSKNNNNAGSESTSSTETLKWLGSMSDVSETSHATGFSAISESVSTSQLIVHSSRVLTPKRHQSESVLYPSEEVQQQSQQFDKLSLGAHNQQHSPQQKQQNTSLHHLHSPSYPPTHTNATLTLTTQPVLHKIPLNGHKEKFNTAEISAHKSNIAVTISNSESVVTVPPQPPPAPATKFAPNSKSALQSPNTNYNTRDSCALTRSQVLNNNSCETCSLTKCGANQNLSASLDSLAVDKCVSAAIMPTYRSNHRLFPISTYVEPVLSNTSQYVHHPKPQYSSGLQKAPSKPPAPHPANAVRGNAGGGLSPKFITQSKHSMSTTSNYPLPSWQSVATLINDFERSSDHCQQQHHKYSYLDPNKTQRVPNPALKALQKNAVQSYFDRQLQQQKQTFFEGISPNRYQSGILRPHSLQNSPSASNSGEVMSQQAFLRNSLPGNYVSNVMQNNQITFSENNALGTKPPSPAPPPPPPRSRSTMPNSRVTLLRRSSSASDYAEFRDQFMTATQEKLQSQSIKNISQTEKLSFNDCGMPPPPPPPRSSRTISTMPMRRTSSASDYAGVRDKMLLQQAAALTHQQLHPNQHGGMPISSSHHHQTFISNNVQHYHHHHHHHHHNHHHHTQQSFIMSGASVPVLAMMGFDNNWAPERPPKNSNLRVPSPDLPPPPTLEGDDQNFSDEPLPPPPPEILQRPLLNDAINESPPAKQTISPNRRNSFTGASIRKAHNFFATRSTSTNDDVNGGESIAPPLAPRKPNNIEIMPLARSVTASVKQLPKYQQSDIQRAAITSSSTRKRPHNLAGISSSFPIIEENALMNAVALKSPSPSQQYDGGATNIKSSSPPPPLMPRMSNTTINTFGITNGSTGNSSITKTRCNSKASYLPRQNLDKPNQSDPDHGSYKMTLHSNEDVVVGGNSKTSSYDIMANVVSTQQSSAKLPNNLPDVLPLGAKLQPTLTQSNTLVMSGTSTIKQPSPIRYGSSKSLASNHTSPNNTMQRSYTGQQEQQQQRYSTPLLNAFNLAYPYHRSQSLDTNANNTTNIISSNNNPTLMMSSHSPPAKYVAQSLMDLKMKSSLNNLTTTVEEREQIHVGNNNEENSEEESKSIDSLNTSVKSFHSSTNSTSAESSEARMFRAELVNTTLPNSPHTAKKPVVIRQGSLRENIEKITQLQSQLMAAHMQDNTTTSLLRMDSGGSSIEYYESRGSADMLIKNKELLQESNKNPSEIDKVHLESENSRGEHEHRTKEESLLLSKPDPEECKESKEEKNILSQLDSSIDGLKLLQRSELILRVNPSTVEAASQTDDDLTTTDPVSSSEMMKEINEQTSTNTSSPCSSSLSSACSSSNYTTLRSRQKHSIELNCARMMEELVPMLAPNDRLIQLLTPKGSKSIKDYINQLYNPHVHCRPNKRHVGTSTLTRYHKPQQQQPHCNNNELEVMELKLDDMALNVENCEILKRKVNDLVTHLQNKARILSKEQITLDEEAAVNDDLGQSLINKLTDHIKPSEATKCRTFIADVGHITGLLISLSERLAKTENQLSFLEIINDSDNEKKSLENKRNRLYEQLNEAKRLKEDIDRRGVSVVNVLEKYLNAEEFGDFEYFINMKIKLITDSREIADNIKTGEELLNALSNAFRQSDC